MNYLEEFLKQWKGKNPNSCEDIQQSSLEFINKIKDSFDYKSQLKALLLGHVQSGKTSQMLAAICALADQGFKIFILLTSDMTNLQEQTLKRAINFIPDAFNICNETDYVRFKASKPEKPIIVVLKKNSSVLKRWKKELSSFEACKYNPMVILDDEADAASLNTKVNQKEVSAINRLLKEIGDLPPSNIYIQVTATPQAVILQTDRSQWKPKIAHIFKPGLGYCGGNDFYGENSFCIKSISDNEAKILLEDDEIPVSLYEAVLFFLINSIYLIDFRGNEVCNFLAHPGVKIDHHKRTEEKISRILVAIKKEAESKSELLRSSFFKAYEDIKHTCSNVPPFSFFLGNIQKAIERIKKQVLNSKTAEEVDYEKGSNIIIGGNATGRGITFPGLQVVYYCRQAKIPQADTLWQHSRIFGYDRVLESCRIFLPPRLLQIFRHLNEANDALFNVLNERGFDQIILMPIGINPTRKNVLDQEALIPIVGDTNYDLDSASNKNTSSIDSLLGQIDKEEEADIEKALNILQLIKAEESDNLELNLFINCLTKLRSAGEKTCFLIVRTDRNITKGTGTLLSPNDRLKGASITDKTVLTVYRINGQIEKGWSGEPLWIPNIKFPKGRCFYTVSSSL